jgi:mannose-6-phosphate isomerase-like protein (cupin superfamily)
MTQQNTPVFLGFHATETLSEGIVLDEVDFDLNGERKSGFHMATFDIAPNTTSDVDVHDVRETWYVLEGTAKLTSEETEKQISKGDVVYLESRVPHQLHNTGPEALKVLALWW